MNCVPIFWKDLEFNSINHRLCQSRENYRFLDTVQFALPTVLDYRSCTSMDTLVIQSKTLRPNDEHITIKISYIEKTYQETENVQDFSFESFFSSLGGFIGIFLGYSMLQIPELMDIIPSSVKKLNSSTTAGNIFQLSIK